MPKISIYHSNLNIYTQHRKGSDLSAIESKEIETNFVVTIPDNDCKNTINFEIHLFVTVKNTLKIDISHLTSVTFRVWLNGPQLDATLKEIVESCFQYSIAMLKKYSESDHSIKVPKLDFKNDALLKYVSSNEYFALFNDFRSHINDLNY
ncbi:MAG: hypothetical protein J7539_12605 [Niabella sp.]|nr:hypothetical protein [Niabella sp.]